MMLFSSARPEHKYSGRSDPFKGMNGATHWLMSQVVPSSFTSLAMLLQASVQRKIMLSSGINNARNICATIVVDINDKSSKESR